MYVIIGAFIAMGISIATGACLTIAACCCVLSSEHPNNNPPQIEQITRIAQPANTYTDMCLCLNNSIFDVYFTQNKAQGGMKWKLIEKQI